MTDTVLKKHIAELAAEKLDLTKKEANERINSIVDIMTEELSTPEGEIKQAGFGSIKVVATKERKGRNPQTGEEITVPASHRTTFRAGKTLKERVERVEE